MYIITAYNDMNICRYLLYIRMYLALNSRCAYQITHANYSFYEIFTEFRANGSWECIPVHPRLSLHKSKPEYCHVNEVDLHNTSKMYFLMCSFIYISSNS